MTGDKISTTDELPVHYRVHTRVDLRADRTAAVLVQVVFVLVAGTMIGGALAFGFPFGNGGHTGVLVGVTVVACVLYMVLHEVTHGVVMWWWSRTRPRYAVRFPFLTTGSEAYFTRTAAIVVALAPTVVWGVVLIGMLLVLPAAVLVPVYVVTVLNFAGSAGDYLQAYVFGTLPAAALIQDDGTHTTVFLPA